jgi:hypothetical protein
MNSKVVGFMIQADIPLLVWDDPGVGKTAYFLAIGKSLGMYTHTETLSQGDPADIGGFPRECDGVISRLPLQWLARAMAEPVFLFLDEITLAPRANLASALRMINERETGSGKLHAGTRIVAAANPASFTGVDLLPQTANRFAHINFSDIVPLSAWVYGMLEGFPTPAVVKLPEGWEDKIAMHRSLVANFCQAAATEAFRLPKDAAGLGRAWPSRRTWDMAARASAACDAGGEDDTLAIASLVGDGPARAYVTWRAAQDLPDPAKVLADPDKHPLPVEEDKLYIVLASVAAHAVAKPNPKLWAAAWTVCERACQGKKADLAIVAGRILASNMPQGATIPKAAAALLPMLQLAAGGRK